MLRYADLTGASLLHAMSRKAVFRIIRNILLLLLFGGLCIGFNWSMFEDFKKYFFVLFFIPVWILCFYLPIAGIRKQMRIIRDGENYEMFQKYGSPDTIAAIISDPGNEPVLDCEKIILTAGFLMTRDDFSTYLPLQAIKGINVCHSSGKDTRLYLDVYTDDMQRRCYRAESDPAFRSGTKLWRKAADTVYAHMAVYAPECRVLPKPEGY